MAEKIEFRLVTDTGQGMKVKVPGTTPIAKLKEKLLPTLRQLSPAEAWSADTVLLKEEGGAEHTEGKAAVLAGKTVRARMKARPPPQEAAQPPNATATATAAAAHPEAGGGATVPKPPKSDASLRKSPHLRPKGPPSLDSRLTSKQSTSAALDERCVVTIHFVGSVDPDHSHINFRLNPKKVTFHKLRALVEGHAGRPAGGLLFRRSDGRDMVSDDHRTLESVGIVSDTHLDCVEDVLHPPLEGGAAAAQAGLPAGPTGQRGVLPGGRAQQGGGRPDVVHLVLESVSGDRLPAAVALDATIASLAKSVDDAWGIPSHLAIIVWLGRTLSHHDTVRDAGLVDGAQLQVVSRRVKPGSSETLCPVCGSSQLTSPYCPVSGRQHTRFFSAESTALLRIRSQIDGKEYRFPDIRVTATVHKVKVLLAKATGVPIAQQVVSVEGHEVADGFSIRDGGLLAAEPPPAPAVAQLSLRPGQANFPFVSPPAYFFAPPAAAAGGAEPHAEARHPESQQSASAHTSLRRGQRSASGLNAALPLPTSPLPPASPTSPRYTHTAHAHSEVFSDARGQPSPAGSRRGGSLTERPLHVHVRDSASPYRVRDASWLQQQDTRSPAVPESMLPLDELERRTLERMEAARRADMQYRQRRGVPVEYRPLETGCGLPDVRQASPNRSAVRQHRVEERGPSAETYSEMPYSEAPGSLDLRPFKDPVPLSQQALAAEARVRNKDRKNAYSDLYESLMADRSMEEDPSVPRGAAGSEGRFSASYPRHL